MKSETLPSFWSSYESLEESIKKRAKRAFKLWSQNLFHPSLHFKCIHQEQRIWSVRVTLDFRAVGILAEDTLTWFWIGSHDEYERLFC